MIMPVSSAPVSSAPPTSFINASSTAYDPCGGQVRTKFLLALIASDFKCGRNSNGKKRIRSFLQDRTVREYFAFKELHASALARLPKEQRQTAQVQLASADVSALADRVNLFRPMPGQVLYWPIEKRASSSRQLSRTNAPVGFAQSCTRIVCKFSSVQRVGLNMIKFALEAAFQPPKFIYDMKGRGRDATVKEISVEVARGYRKAVAGDVVSAYPSINANSLTALVPLPRAVTEYWLQPNQMLLVRRNNTDEGSQASSSRLRTLPQGRTVPAGLLQGSPTSNIIQAYVFASAFTPVPRGTKLFVQSDNYVLLSKSDLGVERSIEKLHTRLQRSLYGPFYVRYERTTAESAINFLGYEVRRSDFSDRVDIDIDSDKFDALPRKINADRLRTPAAMASFNINNAVKARLSGYSAATDLEDWRHILTDWTEQEIEQATPVDPEVLAIDQQSLSPRLD